MGSIPFEAAARLKGGVILEAENGLLPRIVVLQELQCWIIYKSNSHSSLPFPFEITGKGATYWWVV